MHRLLGIVLALLAAIAAAWAEAPVTVAAPHVRLLPAPARQTSAFMTLRNPGARPVRLVGAESPLAERIELHQVIQDRQVMARRPVVAIPVAAGAETRLAPGGFQMVLIGLREPLAQGRHIPITLAFDDGSTQRIAAPVLAIAAAETGL